MGYRYAIIGSRGYPSTYGGFETLVRRLAPYLHDRGDEVTVYCRGAQRGESERDGIRCIVTRGIESNKLSTLSYGLTSVLHARKRGYDAALVLNVANGYHLPLLKRAGIPTAVNVDGIEWERGKWSAVGKAIFRKGAKLTAKLADEIIVDSEEIGRIWKQEFNRGGIFIPYGADVIGDSGSSRLRALGIEPQTYVLAVARLVPENNVDLLLDALASLPSDLPVVIVGSASQHNGLTKRLAVLRDIRPYFWWLGHVSDQELLGQLWANAAVYFHGHSVGGTNPALLQALGLGAPTVAVDTAYNSEVLGVDYPTVPSDPVRVAERVCGLLETTSERRLLAARGQRTISERYSWNSVLANYRSLLRDLATSNQR